MIICQRIYDIHTIDQISRILVNDKDFVRNLFRSKNTEAHNILNNILQKRVLRIQEKLSKKIRKQYPDYIFNIDNDEFNPEHVPDQVSIRFKSFISQYRNMKRILSECDNKNINQNPDSDIKKPSYRMRGKYL